MTSPFVAPAYSASAFNCPYCGAYARQSWIVLTRSKSAGEVFQHLECAACAHCGHYTVWWKKQMLVPSESTAPMPHPDLPDELLEDYNEAREILGKSPRGAAALMRLVIQKLAAHLGANERDLDGAIGTLVAKGLPTKVQRALDIVRVVGNNAVHPGQLDLTDDQETAEALFALVNTIVDVMIREPRAIEEMYKKLPEGAREAIERRDAKEP